MRTSLRTMDTISWKRHMRVLIRIDGDVAMEGKHITDDFRIRQALPTINAALRRGACVRIISHRGRPHGAVAPFLTQVPVATCLSQFLKKKITFIRNPFDEIVFQKFNSSQDILFFENIRFWEGEEKNSVAFARALSRWGDIYINDAFANSHRNHSSMLALARTLPSYAGMNLVKEVEALGRVMTHPEHPLVAILGGAKLETKVPLIKRFLKSADHVLIGGAIANTLFVALGLNVGKSVVDNKKRKITRLLSHKKLHLPSDVVVTKSLLSSSSVRLCSRDEVRSNEYIVDIGPKTLKQFSSLLRGSRMIVWNGPLGFAEVPRFAEGTKNLASAIQRIHAFKLVGGGDTIALLNMYHALKGFTYISTGGGAMLEFLAGKKLLSIDILKTYVL